MAERGSRVVDIGSRLVALRLAFGYENASAFAAWLQISSQSWNNYERGFRRPLLDQANKIIRKTGVTLDWIYHGNRSGLPLQIADKLPVTSDSELHPEKRA